MYSYFRYLSQEKRVLFLQVVNNLIEIEGSKKFPMKKTFRTTFSKPLYIVKLEGTDGFPHAFFSMPRKLNVAAAALFFTQETLASCSLV